MSFDWDGTDDNGFPTSDGTYDFILTASQSSQIRVSHCRAAVSRFLLWIPEARLSHWLPRPMVLAKLFRLHFIRQGSIRVGWWFLRASWPIISLNRFFLLLQRQCRYLPESSPTPIYAGASQSTRRPQRPPPKPIKGTPGKLGVAWQGDHPDPGTNGIAGLIRRRILPGSFNSRPIIFCPMGNANDGRYCRRI